jgi:3-hydroxyisobutyrate dehydrogenase
MPKLGFVGLGVMGGPMAGHLLAAGNQVVVWNRTAAKAEPLRDQGASVAASLGDLGEEADVIMICVNRSEDVADCLSELKKSARPNTLFIDHSTIAPTAAKEVHDDLFGSGFRFVDAPITGGSMGAVKGLLTIFLGGSVPDTSEALEVIKPYTKRAERVGGPGTGQMAKMANQIAVGGAVLALSECLSFATKAGLDAEQVRSMVGGGSGGSWAFENYGPKMLAQDWTPGFSIKNQRKDFRYCREAAKAIDASIPGTELSDKLLAVLEEGGHGESATAMLFAELLRRHATD